MMSQFNKLQTSRVYLGVRQVLHKALIFSYLNDLSTIIENELMKEINGMKDSSSIKSTVHFINHII